MNWNGRECDVNSIYREVEKCKDKADENTINKISNYPSKTFQLFIVLIHL